MLLLADISRVPGSFLDHLLSRVSTLTADPSLVLLSHLQQLHAGPLDGVEDLQGGQRTRSMSPLRSSRVADSRETLWTRTRSFLTQRDHFYIC